MTFGSDRSPAERVPREDRRDGDGREEAATDGRVRGRTGSREGGAKRGRPERSAHEPVGTLFRVGRVTPTVLSRLLAVAFGAVEFARPRSFVDYWMDLAVEDFGSVEVRPWVYTAARLEGALLVLWGFAGLARGRRREPTARIEREGTTVDIE